MYRYFQFRKIRKTKPKVAIHDPMATQQKIRRTRQSSSSARIGCLFAGFIHYLSLTSLSENGFRGLRFMISDSASSYARDMAGTWAAAKQTHIKTKREGSMRAGGVGGAVEVLGLWWRGTWGAHLHAGTAPWLSLFSHIGIMAKSHTSQLQPFFKVTQTFQDHHIQKNF